MKRRIGALLAGLLLTLGLGVLAAPAGPAQASNCSYTIYALEIHMFDGYGYCGTLWHFDPGQYYTGGTNFKYCKTFVGSENNKMSSVNNDSGFLLTWYSNSYCDAHSGYWWQQYAHTAHPDLRNVIPGCPNGPQCGTGFDNIESSVLIQYYG